MITFDLEKVVVGGLGATGSAVTAALTARGHGVVALDDDPKSVANVAERFQVELLDSKSETQIKDAINEATSVVPSPGIPRHHQLHVLADGAGVPVLSELDLAAYFDNRPRLAITGTNGKTTVTELTSQMLRTSDLQAAAVGNTAVPFISAIDDTAEHEIFVVEASSFALDRTRLFRADAAAWLNLAPDHLDWHGSFEAYAAAKSKIWKHQRQDDFAIAPYGDEAIKPWMTGIEAQLVTFGLGAGDVHCTESELIAHGEAIIAVSDMPLSRPHDQLNACAAVALALSTGVSTHLIAQVLATFEGLAHRTEYVAKVRGLRFFNDSKATTPHATIAALSGFDNAVLIVGGRNKGLDLSDLRELVPALTGVVTIGETSPILAEVFGDLVPSVAANSMEDAVTQAVQLARTSGADVVLSPACASFDWYLNYVERGDHFKRVVEQLKSEGEIS